MTPPTAQSETHRLPKIAFETLPTRRRQIRSEIVSQQRQKNASVARPRKPGRFWGHKVQITESYQYRNYWRSAMDSNHQYGLPYHAACTALGPDGGKVRICTIAASTLSRAWAAPSFTAARRASLLERRQISSDPSSGGCSQHAFAKTFAVTTFNLVSLVRWRGVTPFSHGA
jgi:hypothetical protein